MTFYSDLLWDAATAAGMHVQCAVSRPGGSGATKSVWVNWSEPDDIDVFAGTQSKRYEMEYRHADLPDLQEGDLVSILEPEGATDYYVRSEPYVDERHGADGTYKVALLTRVLARN